MWNKIKLSLYILAGIISVVGIVIILVSSGQVRKLKGDLLKGQLDNVKRNLEEIGAIKTEQEAKIKKIEEVAGKTEIKIAKSEKNLEEIKSKPPVENKVEVKTLKEEELIKILKAKKKKIKSE